MRRLFLVLACAAGLAPPLHAAPPPPRSVDAWSVNEGLPNNAIASLLQSHDGYLWIATWAGAVRFDGVRFTPVAENLPNDHARVLLEDPDGSMWIGVAGGGLARWRDGAMSAYGVAEGLAGPDVRALARDAGGRLWIGTDNGVSILDAGRFETLRTGEGLPGNSVSSLAATPDGGVWVATSGGVCLASGPGARCVAPAGSTPAAVGTLLLDRDGRLWMGTTDGVVVMNQAAAPMGSCAARCFDGTEATALMQARDGRVWVGLVTGGVAIVGADGIERVGAADGLPEGRVVAFEEDAEGGVWAGVYYGGLARIKPKRVRTFSTADGLTAQAVGSIVQDADGAIWAGMQCGPIVELQGDRFVPRFAKAFGGACPWSLWPARDGSLWVGTRGGGLYRVRGDDVDHFGPENGLADPWITGLFEDRDGTIWIGTEFGDLYLFRDGQLSRGYGRADGVATGYLASFAQDRDGRVWIGSNANGLTVYEDGHFRALPPEESPPTRNIAGLLVDSRGDLWIGSAASGLFRRRNGRYEAFGVDQGLGDRLVAVMIEDRQGNLWVGTTRGISRLARDRIEEVADGRAATLDPIVLDRADGMRNTEGSGGGVDPSGLIDRDGRLWFSTIDGIAMIDPASFDTNRLEPPVLIESVSLDTRVAPARAATPIAVPAGTSAIEIAYTAISFAAPSKVRFRYRLGGLETVWHDAGNRRTAYYSQLPPGGYTFQVMAANNDGVWNPAPASVALAVEPFLYQRPGVQLAALALLLVATGGGVRVVSLRRARARLAALEREQALMRERTRIARDLHDDLGTRLTHIALMADSGEAADRLSTAARSAVETLDELVWSVNARHDTVEGFAAYAGRFAEEYVAAAGLKLRFHVVSDPQRLEVSAETRRHLYLAFKEAITNVIKHAGATEVVVSLTEEGGALRLDVADNGRGFAGPGDPTGNGLSNMRDRMQHVGGSVETHARPGGGAVVTFRVPLARGAGPAAH